MKTMLGHEGKLSRPQITRLGGLVACLCGRTPYRFIIDDLLENEFVTKQEVGFRLTGKGVDQLDCLTRRAGLQAKLYSDLRSQIHAGTNS